MYNIFFMHHIANILSKIMNRHKNNYIFVIRVKIRLYPNQLINLMHHIQNILRVIMTHEQVNLSNERIRLKK